jgi:hypothetical protein
VTRDYGFHTITFRQSHEQCMHRSNDILYSERSLGLIIHHLAKGSETSVQKLKGSMVVEQVLSMLESDSGYPGRQTIFGSLYIEQAAMRDFVQQ